MKADPTAQNPTTVHSRASQQSLADLLELISQKLDEGQVVCVDEWTTQHPEHAERLGELIPTMIAMANWGNAPAGIESKETPTNHSTLIGELGDFRILHELGHGGMGTVFEAEQISMGRRVALKVLPFAALAQPTALQRFRNEVRAVAALDHPNIVSVYSVGEERGIHYYAMQLINGPSLADLIRQLREDRKLDLIESEVYEANGKPIQRDTPSASTWRNERAWKTTAIDSQRPSERFLSVARLGIQAAEALQHAHDQGVLHRDIKPSNLMLDANGKLYVTDFGLARIEADAGMTMTGDIVGTLRYMPPEQALGKRVLIDQRADIYSLGATLYELLTLSPPFEKSDRGKLLRQIAFDEPTPPRKLDRSIPADLETIVLKAMDKDPESRYESAQHLADDLKAMVEHRPIQAKPPSLLDLAAKWSRRHVAAVWMIVVMFLAVSIVLSISQLLIGRVNRELVEVLGRERAATEIAQAAERQSADLLYAADVRLAGEALENNKTIEARERLARHIPAGSEHDRRCFAWYYLWNQLHQEDMALTGHGWAFDVKYSPDGRLLASSHESGEVVLYRATTGEEHRVLTDLKTVVRNIEFSLNGDLLAGISDQGQICVWHIEDGSVCTRFTAHAPGPGDLAFSPDGIHLATAANLEVKLHRLPQFDEHGNLEAALETVVTLDAMPGTVHTVDISPNGQWLAFGGSDDRPGDKGCLGVWNLTTNTMQHEHRLEYRVDAVTFVGAQSELAIANSHGELALWNVENGKEIQRWVGHRNSRMYDLTYAKRNHLLVSAAKDSTVRVWDLKKQALLRVIQGHSERVYGTAVCPITSTIGTASRDGTVKAWHPSNKSFSKRLLRAGVDSHTARFAPDEKTLLETANWDHGHVVCHDLVRARQKRWQVFRWGAGTVAFGPKAQSFVFSGKDAVASNVKVGDGIAADQDFAVIAYNVQSLQVEHRIRALSGEAVLAAVSPDGRQIAVAEFDHTIRLWDLSSGQLIQTVPSDAVAVRDLVYSPDGRMLLAAIGDDFRIWSSNNLKLKHNFEQHDDTIERIVVSDDGRLAATVSNDKSVRLWSLGEGRHLRALSGHTSPPATAAFSKDSRRLATGAQDGTIRIWDAVTGQQLIVLRDVVSQNLYRLKDLAFRDDGALLAAVQCDEPPGLYLAEWRTNSEY